MHGPNLSKLGAKAVRGVLMAAMLGGEVPPHLADRHGFYGYAQFCMARRSRRERKRRLRAKH